jgi:outer membrane immunogenic protein
MRRQIAPIFVAASLSLAAGAAAADGYDPAPSATPALMQATDWTGFYINGGAGYGFWSADTTTDAPGRCVSCAKTDHSGKGWLGEVGVGYDHQISSRFVAGVLFNYDFSRLTGRTSDAVFTTAETSMDNTYFVGARAGWLMTPDILNYWSVGYTHTHFSGAPLHNSYTGAPLPGGAWLQSFDAGGWFIGSGLEVAVHDGWFWRSEVRYADYSKGTRAETGISPVFQLNFDPTVGTATTEVVYKFDWH